MNILAANRWPLGVFTSVDTGLGISLEVLNQLAVPTIHLHAPSMKNRSAEYADQLRQRLADQGVTISCVFAGFEGESYQDIPTVAQTVGLVPPATRAERVSELKEIIDFAAQLQVPAVGLHLGFVPHDDATGQQAEIVEITRGVCDYAAQQGLAVHLETGQEPVEVLLAFLEAVAAENLHVNFDPANMILYGCGEPLPALEKLGKHVKSVHCKDAKWSDQPGVTWGQETPLGEGDVDFAQFLSTLLMISYQGPLTIEREIPQEPARQLAEIGSAVGLLNDLKTKLFSAPN